jgi:uncharacterized SAM-dependent methyltransferase
MNIYTNAEIARIFKVTKATVTHWVTNAINRENSLELTSNTNKVQVIKNEHNLAELTRLKEIGQKHKNKSNRAIVSPNPKFYDYFNKSQVIEVINSLKTSQTLSLKYTYLDGGAKIWNEYHSEAMKNGQYPATKKESKMLCQSYEYLKDRLEAYNKVNIIDVGPGNCFLVKDFIEKLIKDKKIDKYIAVDISKDMNDIAKTSMNNWFPDLKFLSYVKDIETESIADVLFENKQDEKTANIVIFGGGTLGNMSDRNQVLKNFRSSLDENDILLLTIKLDMVTERVELSHVKDKFSRLMWVPKLLGIDTENCDVIRRYNENIKAKTAYLILDKDYEIEFKADNVISKISLNKGDEIFIWQFHMSTLEELVSELASVKLKIVQLLTEKNYEYILVSCESSN